MTPSNEEVADALSRLGEEHVPPLGWESRVLTATAPARVPEPGAIEYATVGVGLVGAVSGMWFLSMWSACVVGVAIVVIAPEAVKWLAAARARRRGDA